MNPLTQTTKLTVAGKGKNFISKFNRNWFKQTKLHEVKLATNIMN